MASSRGRRRYDITSSIYLLWLLLNLTHSKVRSPCPGLNVLANHGILPRDGKDYDHDMILEALPATYNLDEASATGLFQQGLRTTVRRDATTFSLDDLIRHDIVEMDASLR